jgi:hypothetical protein
MKAEKPFVTIINILLPLTHHVALTSNSEEQGTPPQ